MGTFKKIWEFISAIAEDLFELIVDILVAIVEGLGD